MRTAMVLLAAGVAAFGFQSEKPSGTIAGQVVNQATGAPLPDAIVKLRYLTPSGDEIMIRQTNDAGRFSFTDLSGRDWELSAECRGFSPVWYRSSRYVPQGRFSLAKNQQLNDIVLKLAAQTVIAGKVLDREGGPVEGAHVTLLKPGYSNGTPHWMEVASAATLDNGEYRIPRVSAGHYLVKAVVPAMERMPSASGVETGYAATFHPEATDVAQAAQVDVADGAEIGGIDIHLVATRLYRVRGRFQPPTEDQGTGNITLVDRADPANIVARGVASQPDYVFDVQRVPPGSYLAIGQWVGSTSTMYIATRGVDVVGQDVGGLALVPARSDEVSGSLKLKSDDRPVNLQKITISIPRLRLGMIPLDKDYPVHAGADRNFRRQLSWDMNFAGFAVTVSDLPEGCYVDSIRYGGRDVPESGIEYTPGATLEITIGADGGRIDGTTIGSDDQPHGGAVVALLPADGKSSPKSIQTDAQGMFHLSAVPPGDYNLLAWDDVSRDDLENPAFVKRFSSQATAITLAPGGTVAASVRIAK